MIKEAYKTIPALPATYAGIKMRSRLEARWAYYFDMLGIPWLYEPDGYALESGNYLPDFKCWDWFVEVKPTENELEAVAPKLAELSRVTGAAVFGVVDFPSVKPQRCWQDGEEADRGCFSHYGFQGKGWTFPAIMDCDLDTLEREYLERVKRLSFNRGGIAEVDWEVLRARTAVIQQRREAITAAWKMEDEQRVTYWREKVDPLLKRLASLDKLAFPSLATWKVA